MAQVLDEERYSSKTGIDTDARWGYSHTRGWIFGYKLHMVSSTDSTSVVVPLTAEVTTANVPDNQVYPTLVPSISSETVKKVHYMVTDPGYDDHLPV